MKMNCASLVVQTVKNLPAKRETWVQSLGWEDPLRKGMATHSSILAWRFRELYRTWGCKESNMTEQLSLSGWIILRDSLYPYVYYLDNEIWDSSDSMI